MNYFSYLTKTAGPLLTKAADPIRKGINQIPPIKVDRHSRFSYWVGINNVLNCADAFKKKEYAHTATQLMKAALKWTMIGALGLGIKKVFSGNPVYIDKVHEQALKGLKDKSGSGEAVENSKVLVDHYFKEQPSFRRWPQSGKDYVAQCLAQNSPSSSSTARYLVEKGLKNNDSSLIREVIKTCSSQKTTSQSCLAVESVFKKEKTIDEVLTQSKKILSVCKKNTNVFCGNAKNTFIDLAKQTNRLDDIVKVCMDAKTSSPSQKCLESLKSIEQLLNAAPTKESWELAKKIHAKCRTSNALICTQANKVVTDNMVDFGSMAEIFSLFKKQLKNPNENLTYFIEKTSSSLLTKIETAPNRDLYPIYQEFSSYPDPYSPPSPIKVAITMAEACQQIPSSEICKENFVKYVDFLKKFRDGLKSMDAFQLNKFYTDPIFSDSVLERLEFKINELSPPAEKTHQDKKKHWIYW